MPTNTLNVLWASFNFQLAPMLLQLLCYSCTLNLYVDVTTVEGEHVPTISSLPAMPFLKKFVDLSKIYQFDTKNFTIWK